MKDISFQQLLTDPEQTEALGQQIGSRLKGGEVIELSSDLGGGKTTFVRGLAAGAGSQDTVSSPTFMVHKPYRTPKFTIEHFDFYRLADPGTVADALTENVADPGSVIVVEWADTVGHVLPEKRIKIKLSGTPTHQNERLAEIIYPEDFTYLFEGLNR